MVKLFLKNSNLCDHNSPKSQTDGQTTCDRKTALCIIVHRAVKTVHNKLFSHRTDSVWTPQSLWVCATGRTTDVSLLHQSFIPLRITFRDSVNSVKSDYCQRQSENSNALRNLQIAFNGLQFRRWQYGSIFICLAVIASETREMSRNSKRIWPSSSSRSSKVIDLGVNGKPICDFLLVINCNFSRLLPFSRY